MAPIRSPHAAAVAAALCIALGAAPVLAQSTCDVDGGAPDPSEGALEYFFPGANEVNVPLDGFVRLHYIGRVPPHPFVSLSEVTTGVQVPGRAAIVANEVHWRSDRALLSNTQYRVHAADLGGTDTEFTFRTGSAMSLATPPVFDGITENPTFTRNGVGDLCGDADAVSVTVRFRRARDNGWPVSDIEYVIYETRGPGISGPVERARDRGHNTGSASSDEQTRSFRLSSANAAGPVCFNIQAVDAYGREDGNRVERCVNPSQGNFFNGCSAAPSAREGVPAARSWSRGALAGVALALGALGATRRRRRRRHPRPDGARA